jgi:3-oxoacyl-[acyl-carrier protein] reductase
MDVALVTGASRGIGRGIAIALGAQGWRVAVNYAGNHAAAQECVAAVRAAGGDALAIQADISDAGTPTRLDGAVGAWAGRIDLLVNNAGIAPSERADLLEASSESFDRLFAVNLKGPFFLTQLIAKRMLAQSAAADGCRGQIINIGSISAYTASINRGDYCMTKAGVAMMTALFAARLAEQGIRVYEVRPGIIATDMTGAVRAKYDALIAGGLTPIRRWGKPEDVARAVVAIARGELCFSTGETINVDGGFHLRTL